MPQNKPNPTTAVPAWLLLVTVTLVVAQSAIAFVEIPNRARQAPGVSWISPEEFKVDKDSPKLLLYYFSADWCEGCHKLEATAFKNKKFVDLVDREFIPVNVIDKHKETGKNSFAVQALEGKYNVIVFPTMVVALPSGERAYTSVGANSSWQTIKELKKALNRANYTRGKTALNAGKDQEAIASFQKYLTDEGWGENQSRYAAIFSCVAYAEQQKFDEMREFAVEATKQISKHEWPYAAVRFFAGQITADELLEKTDQEKGKLTEAKYYLGAYQCAKGNIKEGKELLEWVSKQGQRDYEEYELSLSRLQRLKSSH
jgi:thiol-disulfide isomerase/thioredoxin